MNQAEIEEEIQRCKDNIRRHQETIANVFVNLGYAKRADEVKVTIGSRHHVHLSSNYNTALEVAKRRRKPYAILCVDAGAMQDDGIEFFISENKVVLVDFVPVKYLKYMDHAVEVAPFIKSLDTSKYRGNGDVLRCKVTFTPMPKYKPQTDTED